MSYHYQANHSVGMTAGVALLAFFLIGARDDAWSQTAQPGRPAASRPDAPPPTVPDEAASQASPDAIPTPPENPGLLNELGKLLKSPSALLPELKNPFPDLKSPRQTIEDINTRAKEATDGLPRVAPSAMVTGRAACPVASNGAPDCKAGADKLCQSKGFKDGRSLDTDAARTCSSKAFLSGARSIGDICKTENFVTRAMCQ